MRAHTRLMAFKSIQFQVVAIGQRIEKSAEIVFGLVLVILGLAQFTFGLLYGLMPMGERLGRQVCWRVGNNGEGSRCMLASTPISLHSDACHCIVCVWIDS